MSVSFNSLGRNQLHRMVAQQIVDHISAWRLRVGDQLPGERRLSADLGVSRAAVREGLKFLSAKGVVEVSHGRKTVIAADPSMLLRQSLERFSSSDETILNLYEARESFEAEIAALAAERATAIEVEQLAQLVAQMKELPANAERTDFVKLDLAFHNLLAQSTHNPVFSTLLQSIRDLIVKSRYRDISLKHTLTCTRDHERIFLAIRARDADRARNAMKKHLRAVKATYAKVANIVGWDKERKEVHGITRTAPARWG